MTENDLKNADWQSTLLGETLFLGVLSKAIQNDPDRQWLQVLVDEEVFSESPLDGECEQIHEGLAFLQAWTETNRDGISDEQFLDLQADYARLLVGPAKPLAAPWESVYFNEDHMLFQEQTVQVRAWYRRFGLEPEKLHQEPDDHVGLELAFLAYLAGLGLRALEFRDENRLQDCLQAQRQFLAEHPVKWLPVWASLMEKHARTPFYRGLALLIHGALLVLASTFDVMLPAGGRSVSLLSAAERLAGLDRSSLVFQPERCLHTRDQSSECAACFELCPLQAIQPGKPPSLKADACQSCLACIPACPAGAYQADDAVASLLECAACLETPALELICSQHAAPDLGSAESTGIRVKGCLAGLGTGAYLILSTLGIRKIVVCTDACQDCPWSGLQAKVERQVSQAQSLLAAWDRPAGLVSASQLEQAVARPLWEAANPPLSRRDLFRFVARQGQVAMARAMENEPVAAGKHPGRDRRRLLAAAAHFPALQSPPSLGLEALGFALVNISEACTACGACSRACPTQALTQTISEDNSSFTLSFSARDCIACGICTHVCAPAAVTLNPAPSFDQVFGSSDPLVLQSGALVRCVQCKTLMAARPGVKRCSLCAYRSKNPFGSSLPPGVKLPARLSDRKRPS